MCDPSVTLSARGSRVFERRAFALLKQTKLRQAIVNPAAVLLVLVVIS